jgi:hypothetical protein
MDSRTIGYVASALVLAAFGMKDMVNLRIVAICSNVAFITYAVMLNLPPILILHVTLLPLNGWRLAQEVQRRMIQQSSRTYVSDQRQQISVRLRTRPGRATRDRFD